MLCDRTPEANSVLTLLLSFLGATEEEKKVVNEIMHKILKKKGFFN
jgi:hypothetical protein